MKRFIICRQRKLKVQTPIIQPHTHSLNNSKCIIKDALLLLHLMPKFSVSVNIFQLFGGKNELCMPPKQFKHISIS